MEVAAYQQLPAEDTAVEETAEAGLQARKPRHQFSGGVVQSLIKVENGDGETSENRAYLDINGGAVEDLDNHKISIDALYNDSKDNENHTETAIDSRVRSEPIEEEEEVVEEEVVELEFEKAVPKLHTHTMHCPNCDSHITRVVLRRKIIKQKTPRITEEPHEPVRLVGCLSCFSLFLPSGNGSYKPFPVFGRGKPASSAVSQPAGNGISREDENCFSIFPAIWKPAEKPVQAEPTYVESIPPSSTTPNIKYDSTKRPIEKGQEDSPATGQTFGGFYSGLMTNRESIINGRPNIPPTKLPYLPGGKGGNDGRNNSETFVKQEDSVPATGHGPSDHGESVIDVQPDASTTTLDQPERPVGQDSRSFEILKSIVYGGLMEEITSLSVVASAAAAGASTLSIIALSFANLIGGLFIIGHNLWDLTNDCYKFSSQEANGETRNKYKELLGHVEHFPLHFFFAILSFLVFGIIPPLTYGYSFHETNDRDLTIIVVASASLLCVGLLAIFKAYVDRCNGFSGYVKIITYYLVIAVSVSGVSYGFGNLIMRLIEQLGLFETTSGVNMSLLSEGISTNPSLAYY